MYSFKEKNKHLRDLFSPEHAQADFEHLKSIEPNNINVMLATSSVEKSAEKILFNLLDLKTREEITAYRRNHSSKAPKDPKKPKVPKESKIPKKPKVPKESKIPKKPKVPKESKIPKVDTSKTKVDTSNAKAPAVKPATPANAAKATEPSGEGNESKKK